MPFTPLHLVLAAPVKAGAPRHFSVIVFGATQIVMDIEPLIRSYRGDAELHSLTHNPLAACLIAIACAHLARSGTLARVEAPTAFHALVLGLLRHVGAYPS